MVFVHRFRLTMNEPKVNVNYKQIKRKSVELPLICSQVGFRAWSKLFAKPSYLLWIHQLIHPYVFNNWKNCFLTLLLFYYNNKKRDFFYIRIQELDIKHFLSKGWANIRTWYTTMHWAHHCIRFFKILSKSFWFLMHHSMKLIILSLNGNLARFFVCLMSRA